MDGKQARSVIAGSFGGVLMLAASTAGAADYICKVRDLGNGFIPETFVVQFTEGAPVATVNDDIISYVEGGPIEVKMKDRGNGRLRFTYRINDIPANPDKIGISYRVDLDTRDNTLGIRGFLPGYTNAIVGKGTCEAGRLRQGLRP